MGKTVVVIDNDRRVIQSFLILYPKLESVKTFEDWRSAVNWINENFESISLVFLDVFMNDGCTGFDMIELFKHRPPIIMMSGDDTQWITLHALQAGVNGFIEKPFAADELERIMTPIVAGGGI